MSEEEWRDILGYEGLYMVSSLGNVRSANRITRQTGRSSKSYQRLYAGKVLKKSTNDSGYFCVALCKDGIVRKTRVHRLVAAAFIPNPENKPFVNHIDGNKQNNSISNLEWVSAKENVDHAISIGLIDPEVAPVSKARRVLRSDGVRFDSVYSAAVSSGTSSGHVTEICKGNTSRRTAKGYSFSYL